MTTKSEQIRKLASEGLSRSEIAASLGIRYQHVYSVLKQAGLLPQSRSRSSGISGEEISKTKDFKIEELIALGFSFVGDWKLGGSNGIFLDGSVPAKPGVYSFLLDSQVVYVGVSERNLRARLYHYQRPGSSMRTSIRVKKLISDALQLKCSVSVAIMTPESTSWKGITLPMHTALEAGLIREIRPAWNLQGL